MTTTKRPPPQVTRFRAEIEGEFRSRFPRSFELCERRGRVLLDQTSHAVRWADPFQVTVDRGDGAAIFDLDGNRFVDYWQGHYANLLGHNPALVRDALQEALRAGRGLQSGMVHAIEMEVAELLARQTGTEVVRFTTSGALGTFYAVLLARAFTGRTRVLKASGGWHGSQPFGLKGVSARDGRFDHLESEGLPGTTGEDVELVRYNDVAALEQLFADHGDKIACFLVEPWLGSGGGIAGKVEFLRAARRLTEQHGALLLCDEIITGFRFRAGDVSALYGVKPDLLILGKVIGGGMPVAAVAGRRDLLALCTRASGRVKFEGGTYSAHELSLVGARAMLTWLVEHEREVYGALAAKGDRMRQGLAALFAERRVAVHLSGWPNAAVPGSSIVMLDLARPGPAPRGPGSGSRSAPESPEEVGLDAHPLVDDSLLRALLLLEGVSARHGLGAISLAHETADLDRTLDAFGRVLDRLRAADLLEG